MANTLNGFDGLSTTVMTASRQVWLAGLGAAVVTRGWAERQAGHVFRNLVREGTAVESRAIRLVGNRIESSLTQVGTLWNQARRGVRVVVGGYADTARALVTRIPTAPVATKAAPRKAGAKRTVKRTAKRATGRATRRAAAR
ncbi:MAG TPA: phasin family protein [Casimicrobiaceae bacterium]|nr:phasin family protein [Casimicrobiaceae bacterium]